MNRIRLGTIACAIAVSIVASVAAQAQTFNTIVTFNGNNGADVTNGVIQGPDGNLYGVSETNVFRITPGGNLYTVHKFCSQTNCTDGHIAYGSLLQTANGNLYGTTAYGGANDSGEIYEITTAGQFKVLYSFCSVNSPVRCADGSLPWAGLVLGLDGSLYGTASSGGASGLGTIFKIDGAGKLTTLHSFCADKDQSCPDGSTPYAPLLLASNGNFYGTTFAGGPLNFGVAFEMTPSGKVTTLHEFCSTITCTDGYSPWSGLIQASNGNLYGTTYYGGTGCVGGCGTVYQLTLSGKYRTVYSFCSQQGCTDGQEPVGGVIEGTDRNLYGTTTAGGSPLLDCPGNGSGSNCGTVFQLTPQGTLNVLHSFCSQQGSCPDGGLPEASLLQATDGTFYGSTFLNGGTYCFGKGGCGTLFTLSMGLGPFVRAQIDFGKVGQIVNILGNNLTGTTSVTFNGSSAQFKVMSDSYLKAQVPTGATTGKIEVTTSSGTLSTYMPFYVF